MTDHVVLKRMLRLLDGSTNFDASTPLGYDGVATLTPGSNQLATVEYAESLANQGSATASPSTKGVIKVSTAAVDTNNPIAVGDNDTRVPTINMSTFSAGYLAALAGTSGTPASTNKYVTADDTSYGIDQSQTTRDGTVTTGEADSTTKHNLLAQSFIAGRTSQIGAALHKLADTGSFTGTVKVALQADTTGSPSGSDLASVTLSNAAWLALNVGLVNFVYGTPYTATVGTTYWLVVTCSTADNSNHPNFGTNTAGGYSSGSVKFKNTTDGWVAISTIDLTFATLSTQASKIIRADSTGRVFGQVWYGTDVGVTDAYAITIPNFPGTLQVGDHFLFTAATANTAAATLNPGSAGAKTIKKLHDQDLETGDIEAGQLVLVGWNGTNMEMLSQVASVPTMVQTTAVKNGADATGANDTVWAHGLDKVPKWVEVNFHFGAANYGGSGAGVWDGTNQTTVFSVAVNSSAGAENSNTSAFVYARQDAAQSNGQTGVVTVDATNVTIAWTKFSGGLGNIRMILKAHA